MRALRCGGWLTSGLGLLAAVHFAVEKVAGGFPRSQGAGVMPSLELLEWLSLWMFGGTLALAACARSLWLLLEPQGRVERLASAWHAGRDAAWVAVVSLLAAGVALLVRGFVLDGIDLTDDESGYRFAARLGWAVDSDSSSLASRLVLARGPGEAGPASPLHAPGWWLLLAPFVALGAPGLAAPLAHAGAVPAFFLALRGEVGPGWARLAALLLALSPMAVLAASTQLEASASLLFASWATWAALRARRANAPAWTHTVLGITLALGLATQPLTAAGLGIPLLFASVASRRRSCAPGPVLAVAIPLLSAAALLVAHRGGAGGGAEPFASVRIETWSILVLPVTGLFRLSTEALGWPIALAPALVGVRAPDARLWIALLVGVLLANGFGTTLGLDLLGPTRIHAGLLPALSLTVLGLRELVYWRRTRSWRAALVGSVAAALFVTGLGYAPVRLHALSAAAAHLRAPLELSAGLEHAAVFVPDGGYAPWCESQRALTPTPQPPVGDPQLRDDVLWLRHTSLAEDRRLVAELLPGRAAYLLEWDEHRCRPRLRELGQG